MPRQPVDRIHPASYAELKQLVKLHGLTRVRAALKDLDKNWRELCPSCCGTGGIGHCNKCNASGYIAGRAPQ